ncbi:erythromycin esterase family protein [Sphingobacterium faecale]|uniref:Erythromycin esterase family protein n=1 Tax=Sphingobacterium faecale TaxID=2803775 RepID=A0ABS1R057_9SPHI|nr:erythromycin esterase family protein [Sphingobacterium faecale]MBL1408053.1 erythromycin esterase family protein [Sphingobacterium faecale]
MKVSVFYKVLREGFVLIVFYGITIVYGQGKSDFFDVSFRESKECSWRWLNKLENADINSDSLENGGFLKINYKQISWHNRNMGFALGNHILCPNCVRTSDKLEISIPVLCNSDGIVVLKAVGFSEQEEVVFTDSVISKRETSWQKLQLNITKSYSVYISVIYYGNTLGNQVVKLSPLQFSCNEKKVEPLNPIFSTVKKDNFNPIQAVEIVPLDIASERGFPVNKTFDRVKVVGLGEATHGSVTIMQSRLQLVKDLVTNYSCTLVLLEIPFDVVLLLDQYVKGYGDNKTRLIIVEQLKLLFSEENTVMPLIDWLREYNSKREAKVSVFGIDNPSPISQFMLMDYFRELLGVEKSLIYLKLLMNGEIVDAKKIAENDENLRHKLGSNEFQYCMYMLDELINPAYSLENRDANMFKRYHHLYSLFVTQKESAAILAHSGHLQKTPLTYPSGQHKTLGSYLYEVLGDKFFSLHFTVGTGQTLQDSCGSPRKVYQDISKPVFGSFESYALSLDGCDYFYYPTSKLLSPIHWMLHVGRNSLEYFHYTIGNLQRRHDGVVFIKESKPILKPFAGARPLHHFELLYNKRKEYKSLLSGYKGESETW